MSDFPYRSALIVGVGPGISASLARRLSALGVKVGLAARDTGKLSALVEETGAAAFAADFQRSRFGRRFVRGGGQDNRRAGYRRL